MSDEPGRPSPGEDRILTLPNAITVLRLLCLPLFLYLLFGRDNRAAAAGLLGALGASDWVDGYLARRLDQVSTLGKVLDPTVDRLLLIVGIGAIMIDGSAPLWFSVAAISREVLVGLLVVVMIALGGTRFDVSWWGKSGTFGLMFAFPFFLASESTVGWAPVGEVVAWITGIPGLAFSWYAAALYVPVSLAALRQGRAGRAETATI